MADALGVPRSARPRQVAEAALLLVGDRFDDDDDPLPTTAAAWLRHLVDLISEVDWQHAEPRELAQKIADDSVSDVFIDDVPAALKVAAPSDRATGQAATEALRRRLPPFCEKLIRALAAAAPTAPPPA